LSLYKLDTDVTNKKQEWLTQPTFLFVFLKRDFITQTVYTECTRISYKIVPVNNFSKYLHYGTSGNE